MGWKTVEAFLLTLAMLGLIAIVKHWTAKIRIAKNLKRTPYNS